MQGNVLGQSGGSAKINGIIEEYKVASGGNVNARSFVKFINEFEASKEGNEIIPDNNAIKNGGTINSAIAISDNKVFVVTASETNLYSKIYTINENTIIAGTITILSGETITCISTTLLSNNRVFVSYVNNTNNLNGIICTIDSNTDIITVGNPNPILGTVVNASSIAIADNSVFISLILNTSKCYLYGIVCTIDGDKITVRN